MKTEMLYHKEFTTREQAKLAVFEYIEIWYNRERRHSTLVLPLLLLPFLSLAFFALGGGKGDQSSKHQTVQRGINTDLPDAHFKKSDPQDKLSLYELTKRDSAKVDNHFNNTHLNEEVDDQRFPPAKTYPDANEQRIEEKLALINREINRPVHQNSPKPTYSNQVSNAKLDIIVMWKDSKS